MAKRKLSPHISRNPIPYPTTEERTCRDGNVVLFLRKHSAQWQARIRRYSGKWYDVSTGSEDFEKAKEIAAKKYDEMLTHQRAGTVDITRQFKDVARLTIAHLKNEQAAGTGKSVYRDYIQAINNYLIPCFERLAVYNIDRKQLAKLAQFRREKLGRDPNRSTVTTHNSALYLVFNTAVEHGFMLPNQVPLLENKGKKPQARPAFTKEEVNALANYLVTFSKTGHKGETQLIRELLLDYVLILANTGMRTGKEALGLKWCNIRRIPLSGSSGKGLEFSVNGKTGKRALIAQDGDGVVTTCLKRIQSRFPALVVLPDEELLVQDVYVFRLRSGKRPTNHRLAKNFGICLAENGLLKNAQGDERTLYSLRHYYATMQILNGVDMATLAVQMGTSIGVLEKHYSKLKPYMKLAMLNGESMRLDRIDGLASKNAYTQLEIILQTQLDEITALKSLVLKLLEHRA